MLARLKANRDLCLDALRGMPGVTVPEPDGAFYLFPRIDGLRRFVRRSAGGCSWRPAWASRPAWPSARAAKARVRICYAAERAILEPAMERLGKFLQNSQ